MILTRNVMPPHLNSNNTLFGGQMMAWLDEASVIFAQFYSGYPRWVTRAIENIEFCIPVLQKALISYFCKVEAVGTTSLKVRVSVLFHADELVPETNKNGEPIKGAPPIHLTYGEPKLVTSTVVTLVAINGLKRAYEWPKN